MYSVGKFSLAPATETAISIGSLSGGILDTTTLAAHDFDVDTRTGFLPPQAPLSRLPSAWEQWEETLEKAVCSQLQLGDKPDLIQSDKDKSWMWRDRVRKLPVLPTTDLTKSEVQLRRAHLVLAWIMHFYIHTLPPDDPIQIPPPITIPLLQVSRQLQLPPVLTYSDCVLYNWRLGSDDPDQLPTIPAIKCLITFTSTQDEAEFYLASARIELAGVDGLELMRSIMDEMFVGDSLAIRRITSYLGQLVNIIHRLREILLEIKLRCDPESFYSSLRPWLRGEDSQTGRKWEFEGLEQDRSLDPPTELSGPSAGQSALIHALDIFLGIDKSTHCPQDVTDHCSTPPVDPKPSFLQRMQVYMPRYHRSFLNHLAKNPRQLRDFVSEVSSSGIYSSPPDRQAALNRDTTALFTAYNAAVLALKAFRDAHLAIAALYIIIPSRNGSARDESLHFDCQEGSSLLRGTGGTDLVRFLKEVRDRNLEAVITPGFT